MLDVMFYEVFREEREMLRWYLPKDIRADFTDKTIQEYGDKNLPASVISIRTQSCIPPEWAVSLKGILSRTTGYDHLLAYRQRTQMDVPCGYLPLYCARAVAEHAIMVSLALSRKLKTQLRHFETFNRHGITGFECQGRNLLVVGVGHIGSQIVDLGKGFRMNVRGVDIKPKLKGLRYVTLKDGIRWADIIICALPLTPLTKNLLSYNLLKHMKRGTIFVNIARGEISPLKDLRKLLREGILGGAGLDVYEDEEKLATFLRNKSEHANNSIKAILKLSHEDNILCTPHNAFNTQESVKRKAAQSVQAITTFLKTQTFPYSI